MTIVVLDLSYTGKIMKDKTPQGIIYNFKYERCHST